MKKRIFNLIILDQSGSMSSIERQAVNGVNETIQTIKAAVAQHPDQEHYVTLTVFNSCEIKMIYDCADASAIGEISPSSYRPSCATPLYDAMGQAINKLKSNVADNDVALVTVITDGEENSSTEFNGASIRAMVETLKTKGWVFAYIGANQDVMEVGRTLAIDNTMAFTADGAGTCEMFKRERSARNRLFSRIADGVSPCEASGDYFD